MVESASYGRMRGVLVLMYGVIVVVMAAVPYLGGFRGNPLRALFLGNLYHFVAAAVGAIFAGLTIDSIQRRLTGSG